ncbi:type II secretion system GspH family protein [Massilia sp. B-10]|nr:type II secretion system GspH family protein [Massilia sp. B-10]
MQRPGARGFTYLGLIVLLMVIGLVGAATLKAGSVLQRAAAEEELLEIGAQFSEALRSYAKRHAGGPAQAAAQPAGSAQGSALSQSAPPPAQDLRRSGHRQG